jgi:hypothetical protein
MKQETLIEELRTSFAGFVEKYSSDSEKRWADNNLRLKYLVLNDNPEFFLQWDVVARTMVVGNAEYIQTELDYILKMPGIERWKTALVENIIGNPTMYPNYPISSGNLIHHAYHCALFESTTSESVNKYDLILEFGGGYGGMARLVNNLGFRGKYIIFDFPEFSALQKYFLKSLGIEILEKIDLYSEKSGVILVSDIDELHNLISTVNSNTKAMFIATWSISETPIAFRKKILPLLNNFEAFLIAYQGFFEGNNNEEYFSVWISEMNQYNWNHIKIEHIPSDYYKNNYYLFGTIK